MNHPVAQQSFLTSRRLDGKVAVVTGSTSGIGLGIAQALAADGAAVVLNGFGDRAEIAALQGRMAADHRVEVGYSNTDVSDVAALEAMIAQVIDEHGRLDILINNAGIQHVAPIEDFPTEKWDAIFAINLTSAFHTARLAVPHMRKQGFGRIINIASAHGLVASPFKSAYIAAKHGMIGLTKAVAVETARDGITVNAICPGYVWTPLVEKQIANQAKARGISEERVIDEVMLAQQPNRKFATVEEIGALAAFLSGDLAASITGAAMPVDGGWTAH